MDKLSVYRQVDLDSKVVSASPHRLIQLLFEAALESVNSALAALHQEDICARGEAITRAVNVIGGLRDSLNPETDSNLPYDLDRLYEYMQRRLEEAHRYNDSRALSEVSELLHTIKSGWDGISKEDESL